MAMATPARRRGRDRTVTVRSGQQPKGEHSNNNSNSTAKPCRHRLSRSRGRGLGVLGMPARPEPRRRLRVGAQVRQSVARGAATTSKARLSGCSQREEPGDVALDAVKAGVPDEAPAPPSRPDPALPDQK